MFKQKNDFKVPEIPALINVKVCTGLDTIHCNWSDYVKFILVIH